MSGTRFADPKAPAIEARLEQAALLICSYGSAGGRSDLQRRARSIRGKTAFAETAGATLFGDPRIEDVVGSLSGLPVLVVPLFMAKGVTYSELDRRLRSLACAEHMTAVVEPAVRAQAVVRGRCDPRPDRVGFVHTVDFRHITGSGTPGPRQNPAEYAVRARSAHKVVFRKREAMMAEIVGSTLKQRHMGGPADGLTQDR